MRLAGVCRKEMVLMGLPDRADVKSALRRVPVGGLIVCLTCVFALLSANDLRVHAGQWAPSDSATAGTGNSSGSATLLAAPKDLETTRKLLLTGNPPELGSNKAPVTIVEFADFECGYCKQMNELLEKQLLPAENNKVKIVYRYFPLPQHPWAKSAAQMAACVQLQKKSSFWKLNDFLYANQDTFSISSLRPQVESFLQKQTKVNLKAFRACVDQGTASAQVDSDVQMAGTLGVHATPTLFVNGIQLHGVHELQQLEDAITAVLKNQATAKQSNNGGML
jgi:protein-disulfide isomerase